MGRIATLVLVSPAGDLLGTLPPVELPCPYWQESSDIVAEVAARFGARVVVLRLLQADTPHPPGGHVAYLAELSAGAAPSELLPVPSPLRERAEHPDPKRMPWAAFGGPTQSLEWARRALASFVPGTFTAVQQRTWNLSTLWRLEPASLQSPSVWLKQVPSFMHHESTVLRWLNEAAPGTVPELLAGDDCGRMLLADVGGDDLYAAPFALRQLIHEQLHVIQSACAGAVAELLALGLPDRRGARCAHDIRRKLLAWSPHHPGIEPLLLQLEKQLERLEECGLPATLVHADNHPGNARGSHEGVRLLDWGEAFIGNAATDLLGLRAGLAAPEAARLSAHWCAGWKRFAPSSKPELALELTPFVAAMQGAATFAHFLDQIEESEHPYHRDDVPRCLEAAAALLPA